MSTNVATNGTTLDHIVVAARTLDEGRAWCREMLGVDASGGGKHAGLATHNTLLRLSAADDRQYLEIIAVDPNPDPNPDADAGTPSFPRWFGLDSPRVQREIAHGPRLVAWVARCSGGADAIGQLAASPGYAASVVRPASRGDFRWRFAFTPDGERIHDGVLPHLIQWDVDMHPCDRLPDSGVRLSSLLLGVPAPDTVAAALAAFSFDDRVVQIGQSVAPQLVATLQTPQGVVILD